MKNNFVRFLLFFGCIGISYNAQAEWTEYDFFVESESDCVLQYSRSKIEKLDSVAIHGGPINAKDLFSLRQASQNGILRVVNLEDATMLNNVFPKEAFWETQPDLTVPIRRFILPEGVEIIDDDAFRGSMIEMVNIPSTVKTIGKRCFKDCSELKLKDLKLPEGIEDLPEECFFGSGLRGIKLCEGLKTIGSQCFDGSQLEQIIIPESMEKFQGYAFANCLNLKSIVIPKGMSYLGSRSFSWCSNLESVIFTGPIVDGISFQAFGYCEKLREVVLPEGIDLIEENAFRGCSSLKEIIIPEGVTFVSNFAFCESGLEKIVLPSTIEFIASCSFGLLENLKEIYCNATTPPESWYDIRYNSFETPPYWTAFGEPTSHDVMVYVPVGCAEAYRRADGWDYFHNFIELEELSSAGIETATVAGGEGDMTTRVYSLSGTLVAEGEGAVDSLTPGLYIVNSADGTRKLLVK